jgi:6-phosphogluconolactonase
MAVAGAATSADFWIGSYTRTGESAGIYSARLNLETGEISAPALRAEAPNPSALALSPDGRSLYAVLEFTSGTINAYRVGPGLSLSALGQQNFDGGGPCHLSVAPDGKTLLAAAYGGGSVGAFPIGEDGGLGAPLSVTKHRGSGPVKGRQEGPHMHYVTADAASHHAYAACLGSDTILQFKITQEGLVPLDQPLVKAAPGAGPRHLVMTKSGQLVFSCNELNLTVDVWSRDIKLGNLSLLSTLTAGPGLSAAEGDSLAAIQLHPSEKFLYVSTRGKSGVSLFGVEARTLTFKKWFPLSVKTPRSVVIDPSGKWLIAAGQDSNTVASYKIDTRTGDLKASGHSTKAFAPTWIEFAR